MESFEQLFKQYKPMIHSIMNSLHIYKNKEEFLQLGLIGLWEAYKRFDPDKGNFTTYAYTSIKGMIMTEMSKTNRHEERAVYPKEDFWEYIEDGSPICLLEEETLLGYCKSATLTEKETKWVLYTFLKGLNVKGIAQEENVSVSAIKKWREGAKGKLKGHLKDI
ncbi:sigma-70 family RNA polymerase sigma factor [Neobacillus sp. PS3-34]|uniref:sigma-70 family RNA polymerase sigma factor n=1 Tax=Neobacillus sp. PS3-34 TaxID=3070678 RepID=UPI0027E0A557|nr:sigma-70 family RNA polymerase sigma factor [Neobacillus sp. PS3-34]WML48490.1 sigma-70 family RNA polymerase sigma factor [Neobacillus sp. PS3-34]